MQEYPVKFQGKRWFVVIEQAGRAWLVQNGAQKKISLFNYSRQICSTGWEEGLLGLALDPQFLKNRRMYIYYSLCRPKYTAISRLTFSKMPHLGGRASQRVLMKIRQPYGNHNGGMLAFGRDGYLYAGVGDGGSGGDPHNHGQNKRSLLGTILRIDVRGNGGYRVPATNPFVKGGGRKEIYAYGLRNPWRFSFDKLNGRLYAGDVGQNRYEEIHVIERGKNYGWRIQEGRACFRPRKRCNKKSLEQPIYDYGHSLGRSVVGGYVYRGRQMPALRGKYIFADTITGRIWVLDKQVMPTNRARQLLKSGEFISSFAEDRDGELYVLGLHSGKIFKIKSR